MSDNTKMPDEFEGLEGEYYDGSEISSVGDNSNSEETTETTASTETTETTEASTESQATQEQTTETNQTSTQAPQFNYSEVFGEEIKDIDQAKGFIAEAKKAREEVQRLTAELEEQKSSLSTSPAAKYDAWIKETQIEDHATYDRISKLDLDSPETNPVEILVAKRLMDKKGKMSAEDQSIYRSALNNKYKIGNEYTDEETQMAKFVLEDDVDKARESIKQVVSKINSFVPADKTKVRQELVEKWTSSKETLGQENLGRLNFSVKGEEGQPLKIGETDIEIPIVFDAPKEQVEQAFQSAYSYAIQSGMEPNEANIANLKAYVSSTVAQANFSQILRKAVSGALDAAHQEYSKLIENPSALKKQGDTREGHAQEKTDEDLAFEMEMKNMGG